MKKETAKELLMDFLVRNLENEKHIAEALIDSYLDNDSKAIEIIKRS